MAHLSIHNVGPVRDIDIALNRVNVFIGPQSCGKSTVAKIISFCQWLEKDLVVRQGLEHVDEHLLVKILMKYHNMTDYFGPDSAFHYTSDVIDLDYADGKVRLSRAAGFADARVSKNTYIPAERNVVALPGVAALQWPQFYLRNFLFDWLDIRAKVGAEPFALRNLGVSYRYRPSDGSNMIVLPDGREIHLDQASSGMQSATPLYILLYYFTRWIYDNDEDSSYEKLHRTRGGAARRALADAGFDRDTLARLLDDDAPEELRHRFDSMLARLRDFEPAAAARPQFSNIVIEEPEQNLFPQTQVALTYDILSMLRHDRDYLTVTTHSPFILYALNNCMLAYTVAPRITPEDAEDLDTPPEARIAPASVAVYELRDGHIENYDGLRDVTIQDADGLVRGNYFDRVMTNIMADFSNLMNLREEE